MTIPPCGDVTHGETEAARTSSQLLWSLARSTGDVGPVIPASRSMVACVRSVTTG